MRSLLTGIAFALLLLGATEGEARSSEPLLVIAGHDVSKPVWGIRYGAPQRWSGSVTFIVGEVGETEFMPHARGLVLSGDLGEGGGKASLGLTVLTPGRCLLGFYSHGVVYGAAAKASVLRSWGNPSVVQEDATYVGPELEVAAFFVNLTIGYMIRVAGPDSSRRDFLAWSAGVGF